MRRIIALFFVLFPVIIDAQEHQYILLKGKIYSELSELGGVYVINMKTEKTVVTNEDGSFLIPAQVGDALLFSSIQFKEKRVVLTLNDFQIGDFVLKMDQKVNELKEVVVGQYSNINAVSLGIISANHKVFTPAERKLKAASEFAPTGSAAGGMAGGSVSFDAVLNLFSGRTAMLKKELKVERKELFIKQIELMFDENYFIEKLKIPSDYVKGFEYFVVENEKFTTVLKTKNKTSVEFLLAMLANDYLEIIVGEKK